MILRQLIAVWMLMLCTSAQAFVPSEQFSDIQYKDLITDTQGFISNTSGDGFFVLNNVNLSRDQMCGLLLTIEFQQAPQRASIFDVYWRTAQAGFSESQKGFFIINQSDAANKNQYLVPLCKLFSFSGNLNQPFLQANITALRLDFPPNKTTTVRFEAIEFLSTQAVLDRTESSADIIKLEPYEAVSAQSFTSLDVIIPKLVFAFEHGLQRLLQDVPFLVFWLLLILFLKVLILRSFVRQIRTDKD